MAVLVDTGILYALADADDRWHEPASAWLDDVSELLIVSVTALPEVAYLLQTRLGAPAELAFVQSLSAGELELEDLRRTDLVRCSEVMRRYPDIGFVDASIVAIAERLKIEAIATTDRRHFQSIRPKHTKAFKLLP
jgi:predicted nucleic acid-binding protein